VVRMDAGVATNGIAALAHDDDVKRAPSALP